MLIKPELTELFEWLQKSDKNRFEIYNVDNNSTLEKNVSYAELAKNGATIEDYFTKLVGKGIKTVQINTKQKHGSTFIRDGCSHNYTIGKSNDAVAASGSQADNKPGATPQQSNGLGSPASFGLGGPEVLKMHTDATRFNEVAEDKKNLQAKVDRMEIDHSAKIDRMVAENKVLSNENLVYKIGKDSKPSAVDKLIESLASNPSTITQIIASFKPGVVPGLNAPEATRQQLSDVKNTIVDLVSNNTQVTDRHVQNAYYVLVESLKGNESFMNDYFKILQQHKIKNDGQNATNYSNT